MPPLLRQCEGMVGSSHMGRAALARPSPSARASSWRENSLQAWSRKDEEVDRMRQVAGRRNEVLTQREIGTTAPETCIDVKRRDRHSVVCQYAHDRSGQHAQAKVGGDVADDVDADWLVLGRRV